VRCARGGSMSSLPKISVVVATYNRCALLARTLPTLLDQNLDPTLYEVVVISDGSTDGTLEFLKQLNPRCGFQVLQLEQNRGQSTAANAGARTARGELLVFLDDDIICDRGLLQAHLEAHRDGLDKLVFGPVYVSDESPNTLATEWTRRYTETYTRRLQQTGRPVWPHDANVDANSSLPRTVFLAAGGFDETFLSARQNEELGSRLWHGGLRFEYAPHAITHQIFIKSNYTVAVRDSAAYGRAELRMTTKLPFIRSCSTLPLLFSRIWLPRKILELFIRLPFSVEPLLRPACGFAQALWKLPPVRSFGVRILAWRRSITYNRAALAEAGGWKALQGRLGMRLPIMLYHHIGPAVPGTFPELTISRAEFERDLCFFKRHGYNTITPTDWLAWCDRGTPLPSKPLMLTFDDAYEDLASYCFPALKRYGFTGVVFVPTANIGGANDWDFAHGSAPQCILSAKQIRSWAEQGIEFGAHTRTHADLGTLTDDELDDELEGSRRDLEAITGRPVIAFAYPFGRFGERELERAGRCFELCFTIDQGINTLHTDRRRMQRSMMVSCNFYLNRWINLITGHNVVRFLRDSIGFRTRVRRAWRSITVRGA
jgi:glycosyltransferase involved in cell wall biosynthesis/peptidoglycan/xylan/chitin deacetylase (PgdA/CDA1 family)